MFHSLPHFPTPTQTSPPERTAPRIAAAERRVKPLARLPRCATSRG